MCLYKKFGFCKMRDLCTKIHLKEECQDPINCVSKKSCDKRHPKLCRNYALHQRCSHGDRCDYLHKEKEKSPEEINMNHRLEELEKLVRDKCESEKKMEVAVKALENVVKVMTRKVINLEKELVNVKDSIQNSFENKTKVGLVHKKTVKEKVNDFKEDIFTFDPKSASSPKEKDKGRKEEIKEHLFSCFKCDYKL